MLLLPTFATMVSFAIIQEVIQKYKHCFTGMDHCVGSGCSNVAPCKSCIIVFEKIKSVVNNEENIKKKLIASCIHQAGNDGWHKLLKITGNAPIARKRSSPPPADFLYKRLRMTTAPILPESLVSRPSSVFPRPMPSSMIPRPSNVSQGRVA